MFNLRRFMVGSSMLMLALGSLPCSAEKYSYSISNFDNCPNPMMPNVAGHNLTSEFLDLNYDDVTGTLTLEAEFSNKAGNLPTGFHFGISDGSMPKGVGNIATIYFDASNLSDTKVSAYSYNTLFKECGNYSNYNTTKFKSGSWRSAGSIFTAPGLTPLFPSDPIFSSHGANSDYVLERTASDRTVGSVTYRSFRLVLDSDAISTHDPLMLNIGGNHPYGWEGARFGEKIGLWFYAVNGTKYTYNQGFLTDYGVSSCYICDFDNLTANKAPVCDSVTVSPSKVKIGSKVEATITAKDAEKDQLLVTYTGAPASSVVTPSNNGFITPDTNGKAAAKFSWIPQVGNAGKYTVNVSFTQQYGSDQTSVTCPFSFDVSGCNTTDWNNRVQTLDTQVAHDLPAVIRRMTTMIKRNGGRNTARQTEIKTRAKALGTEAWTALNAVMRLKNVIRVDCGGSLSGCEKVDASKALTRIAQISAELLGFHAELAPSVAAALRKNGKSESSIQAKIAQLEAKANQLSQSINVSAASLPTTVYACKK